MTKSNPELCAARLKTLSDETRLAVVRALMHGPRHVGELMQALDVEQSLLSHHLRVLRDARIVAAERDGKSVLYRLVSKTVSGGGDARTVLDLDCCRISFD